MKENSKPTVVGLPNNPDNAPISDIEPRQRLGTLIRRFRNNAGKSLRELAEHLDVSEFVLDEVEKGILVLGAAQLQEVAGFLAVRYDPLLEAARDWHAAVWSEEDKKGGVQLSEMTTRTASLYSGDGRSESALELALIKTADELAFLANVSRETSIRAEQEAVKARELLERRGISLPQDEAIDGPETVVCAGPRHSEKLPVRLRRGKDFVLTFQPEDGGDVFYFCCRRCGDEWRAMMAKEESEIP